MEAGIKLKKDNAIFELFPQAIAAFKKKLIDPIFRDYRGVDQSIKMPAGKSELFTWEQLKKFSGCISEKPAGITADQLYHRLTTYETVLHEVNGILKETDTNPNIQRRLKWLMNNFCGIIKQINIEKLCCLKTFPRVEFQRMKFRTTKLSRAYRIAVEIISHNGGHIDLNNLYRFTIANQITTFLKPGKLSVFPILLRLALIESLCRMMIQTAIDIGNEMRADNLVEQFIAATNGDSKELQLVMDELSKLEQPMVGSFLVSLSKKTGEKGRRFSRAINWLKQQAAKRRVTIDELTQEVNKKQRADQLSIVQHINSLFFLSSIDWNEFVENNCLGEQLNLRNFKRSRPFNVSFSHRSLYS